MRAPQPHRGARGAHAGRRIFAAFLQVCRAARLAQASTVIWFFEKESDLIVCEIRRAADDEEKFEFEIADATGPMTLRFSSPSDLITKYLHEQSRLLAQGWRPRNADA